MTHISRDTCRSQKIHTESPLLFMSGLWRSKEKLYPKKKQMLLCFLPEAEVSPHLFATIQWWIWKRNVSTFSNFILQAVEQLNCHLIIITKEQQKDKGMQKRFFWGLTFCHSNVPKGSVPSTHGFGRSTSTACAFQQDRDCVRFTTCATLPKITQIVTPQMYTVLPEQELGRNNWKKMMNINKKWIFIEVFSPGFRFGRFGFLW